MLANDELNSTPHSRASALLKGAALVLVAAVVLAACDNADKPYLAFAGGGFIFNYRQATADYGFVARVERALPAGGVIEAQFDNPAGGAPIVVRQDVRAGRRSYVFRTPPLRGVRANHDYQVVLRLLDTQKTEIASYKTSYRSSADQSVLPGSPPVVGPGYQRAPRAP